MNIASHPILATERLRLRELSNNDAFEIFSLRSNDEINRYIARKKCIDIEEAKNFINKIRNIPANETFYWAICTKENNTLIGTITLWNLNKGEESAEIGFELLPTYWNRGLMKEAAGSVLDFAFNVIHLKAIDGNVDENNLRSVQLLKKLEFQFYKSAEDNLHVYRLNNFRSGH